MLEPSKWQAPAEKGNLKSGLKLPRSKDSQGVKNSNLYATNEDTQIPTPNCLELIYSRATLALNNF